MTYNCLNLIHLVHHTLNDQPPWQKVTVLLYFG